MSGHNPYYAQRAIAGAGHNSPAMRSMIPDTGIGIGSGPYGPVAFQLEHAQPTVIRPHADGPAEVGSREQEKKKRGRPRKYGPDGSPASSSPRTLGMVSMSGSGSVSGLGSSPADPNQKRGRGRPPGSGKIQRLSLLGEWAVSTAGRAFTPHVLKISEGEDIAAKIASFSQEVTRAVCVMSASGAVSRLTLSQPSTSRGSVTYEGRFQIIYLSGSYMMSEEGGTRTRTGDLSVAVSSPEGQVFGGTVGGVLIAATTVQVIVGSFVYYGPKAKNREENSNEEMGTETDYPSSNNRPTPVSHQNLNPPPPPPNAMVGWPGSRQLEFRPGRIDIDLARG